MQTFTLDAPANSPPAVPPRIHVCRSEGGGWNVQLTRDDRILASDHYTDWHRVERRCSILEAQHAIGYPPSSST